MQTSSVKEADDKKTDQKGTHQDKQFSLQRMMPNMEAQSRSKSVSVGDKKEEEPFRPPVTKS